MISFLRCGSPWELRSFPLRIKAIAPNDYKNTGFTLRAKDGHCIECARAAKRRYKKSQKGRITENRYGKSSTGKAKYARYNQNKGKETKRAYVTKNLDWNRERSRRGSIRDRLR